MLETTTEQKTVVPSQTKKDIALKQIADLAGFYTSFAGKVGYNPFFYVLKEIEPVLAELNILQTGDVPEALQVKIKKLLADKAEANAKAPATKAEGFLYRKLV